MVVGDELGLFLFLSPFFPSSAGVRFLPVDLSFGLFDLVAFGDGRVGPLGDGAVEGSVCGVVCGTCATSRKRSRAWRITVSTRLLWVEPGTWTTISLLPCVVTSASETPEPLTRASMMSAAWLRLSLLTLPSAISVIWVPPSRSSPSAGFQVPTRATRP